MAQIFSWNLAARAAVFSASLILATGISIDTVDMPGVGIISRAIASIATFALGHFGVPATQDASIINAGGFIAIVSTECTAIEILLVFSSGVLVWPVSLRAKAVAILLFIPILVVLNLVRVISLLLTGVGIPEHFDTIHLKIWQPVMLLAAIAMWLLWQRWASEVRRSDELPAPRQ